MEASIIPRPETMPMTESSTTAEPSNTVQASHSVRPTLTSRDNVLHASQHADSTAPEGGHGWIVVLGCWCVSFWYVGTLYSWGVMQAALYKQRLSSPATLSWIGSLGFTCISTLAILNARVIQLLGARKTALIGISLLGLGEILSGFLTHHVGGLFITTGVVSGIGSSLCFLVVNVTPAQYFHRRRGLANGIVSAGGGLGGLVISLSMNALLQHVGPAWTFRILGLVTLATGLSAAWLIRERCPIQSATFIEWSQALTPLSKTSLTYNILNRHLFRDFNFTLIFLVSVIALFPLLVPPFFVPLYSDALHLSTSTGAALVATFNISSAVGRFTAGVAADALGPLNTLLIGLFLTTLSFFAIWPVSNSLAPLIIFVIINGAANGGFFATMPTVMGTVFGSQRVSVTMGMIVTGWTGGYLMGAPIAGYLLQGDQSSVAAYHPAMWYSGSLATIAMLLTGVAKLYMNRNVMSRV